MAGFLTDDFAVSGQIDFDILGELKNQGFTDLVCNRPDEELASELGSTEMKKYAEANGLCFHYRPLRHDTLLDADNSRALKEILESAEGKVFAYCASGTRSTINWAFSQAGVLQAGEIIERAAAAGYDIGQFRPALAE